MLMPAAASASVKEQRAVGSSSMCTFANGLLVDVQLVFPPLPPVPPLDVPPLDVPPLDVPPLDVPPLDVPPLDVPPLDVPPLDVPPEPVLLDCPPQATRRSASGIAERRAILG